MIYYLKQVAKKASWESLQRLTSAKLFASSFIFLFGVPIVAKLLSEVPDQITVPIAEQVLVLHLRLPFRLVLLFLAALFIAIANSIYFIWCPLIVRRFRNYGDFQAAGLGPIELIELMKEILPETQTEGFKSPSENDANEARSKAIQYLINNYLGWPAADRRRDEIATGTFPGTGAGSQVLEKIPYAFAHIRNAAGLFRQNARYAMLACIFVASLCFSIVALQSILWMFQYLMTKGV